MVNPTVSILIPTKNRLSMLKRAVNSALAQTVPCEIVIVDGASTDGTRAYLSSLDTSYPNVHVVRFDRDPGFLPSWYVAAACATGQCIHYCLDDDWLESTCIENKLKLLDSDVSSVISQALIYYSDSNESQLNLPQLAGLKTGHYASSEFENLLFKIPMTITPSAILCRRQTVLDYLYCGKIPHAPYRMNAADCFMVACIIGSAMKTAWVQDPLVNLDAHGGCSTIVAMQDESKYRIFLREYADMKKAYLYLKGAL